MSENIELLFEDYPALNEEEKDSIITVQDNVTARMEKLTSKFEKQFTTPPPEEIVETEAGPVAPGYPWWNILIYGPYQPMLGSNPQKNLRPNDFAFIFGQLWMNPAPIINPGPSAAQLMGAFDMQINFETTNVSLNVAGPPIPPIVMEPIGGPWLIPFFRLLGPGVFPMPDQGRPHKYEMHVTADVSGPVPQPFFAGFSTWMFDPDLEPAIWPPFLRPIAPPHWHFDVPCQFLVYRA